MYLDNALYTAYNFNLKNIMNYVWTFINNSNKVSNKVELEKRLIEEMREMNNTCSSGYLLDLQIFFLVFRKWWRFYWRDEANFNYILW